MPKRLEYPRMRAVEPIAVEGGDGRVVLRDPTGIASGMLALSGPALFIILMMDGRHSRLDIQERYMRRFGQMLFSHQLDEMIGSLEAAFFLDGPAYEAERARLRQEYHAAPVRTLRDAAQLAPAGEDIGEHIDRMLATEETPVSRLLGLVAPHLDYPRGAPCYATSYTALAARTDARRFIVLGTNHFGESSSVVGTRKDFETPWGVVQHDRDFMRALDEACGLDLCENEFDHVREHSVELQVVLLRRVLGDRPFSIVPYLCPDACGQSGTRPRDGSGVDLGDFAAILRRLLEEDGTPTCLIAGADLSHIGGFFGDSRSLEDGFTEEVATSDGEALGRLITEGAEPFRAHVAERGNATRICSSGCLYILSKVLDGRAKPRLTRYHQASTPDIQNCVTCASIEYAVE